MHTAHNILTRATQDDAFFDFMAMGGGARDAAAVLDDRRKGDLWVWDSDAGAWAPGAERGLELLKAHHREHWRLLVGACVMRLSWVDRVPAC